MSRCPVCRESATRPAHTESGCVYVRCADCGLVRMDPLPTTEEQARRHHVYLPETTGRSREFDLVSRESWARARRLL